MKNAKIKSIFIVFCMLVVMAAITYAMTISLNSPTTGIWYTNSSSVDHVFTPVISQSETLTWCAINSNRSGSWVAIANYTTGLSNNSPFQSGVSWIDTSDASPGWNVTCYNGTNLVESNTFNLGVDSNPPSITLDGPSDNTYSDSTTVAITYTPTDASNLDSCVFYIDSSGTFSINETNTSPTTGDQNTISFVDADAEYTWNVLCNDSANTRVWAEDTNRTFTIDTTAPSAMTFVTTNNTVSSDTTPLIKWTNTSEANFDEYEVLVSTSLSAFDANILQTKSVSGRTNNATTLNELPTNDLYYIKVRAVDLAGNVANTTYLYYTIDSNIPVLTLNYPSDGTYTSDSTPGFNVTVVDNNPDSCLLWLSNSTGDNVQINVTDATITSGVANIMTPSTLLDGNFKFNIECNDSLDNRVNVSSTLLDLIVDATAPTSPDLTITWGQTNNTDTTPTLSWLASTETNFAKYVIEARKVSNGDLEYTAEITTKATVSADVALTVGETYNFSVTAYDLADNTATSINTTKTNYYVDPVCGTLAAGWNLCGATWTAAKNLSVIGTETSATFVTVWNSTHEWSTCIVGVSNTNCDIDTGLNKIDLGHVWVYVTAQTAWEDRTWVGTQASTNITLGNNTNGWNIIPGEFRNGRNFGDLGRLFTSVNVSMFSLPYINGSTESYVNKPPFSAMAVNTTVLEYGKAMWVYYNGTGTSTFDVGGW